MANRQEKNRLPGLLASSFWLTIRRQLLTKSKNCNRGRQATQHTGFRDPNMIFCSGFLVSSSSNPSPLPIQTQLRGKGIPFASQLPTPRANLVVKCPK